MCGICGTAGFADQQQLDAMNTAILHRGPDDGGTHIVRKSDGSPWIGLANRRLSIIDLSSNGHQPMRNEDGSIWIVYNGEVYNFLELRPELEAKGHTFHSKTDTEVLIHLYEERGIDFLSAFNGMFGLALWDDRKQRLFLARDPFGIKPLYYLPLRNGKIAFASETKSFLASGLYTPEVDSEALHYYLNFLWVPGPKTLFKGVYKLMPGQYLLWKEGQYNIKSYWNGLPSKLEDNRSEGELIVELRHLLRAGVERHLISDVPLGVFLSGGLDSSTMLALGTQITNRPMTAYTITFRDQDALHEQSDEDPKYARMVAKMYRAEHRQIKIQPDIVDLLPKIVWHLDEPVADPAAITSYLICEAAGQELTVLLSGQGGDEIFGGYSIYLRDIFSRYIDWLPKLIRDPGMLNIWDLLPRFKNYLPGVRPGKVMAFHRYFRKIIQGAGYLPSQRYVFHRSYYTPGEQFGLYSTDFRKRVESFDAYETHLKYFPEVSDANFVDQMLYVDQKTFLPELNLTYSDKTSMASSVEARVPLLDQDIASFMRNISPEYKIRGIKQKYLFKKAMEGVLPHSLIWRRKAPFSAPIRSWLRYDLGQLTSELLSEESISNRGYFNPGVIRQMVKEHQNENQDHSLRIWALLTLEIWHQIFIDQEYNYL